MMLRRLSTFRFTLVQQMTVNFFHFRSCADNSVVPLNGIQRGRCNTIQEQIVHSPFPDVTLQNVTIDELLLGNERWPDRVAVECAVSGKKYTFSQLRRHSRTFAASLRQEGLQRGDVLSIILPNIPDYVIVVLGALQAGLIVSPINPIYTSYELVHHLKDNNAIVVVTSSDILPKLDEVKKEIESQTKFVYNIRKILVKLASNEQLPRDSINYEDMISDKAGRNAHDTICTRQPNDVAVFSYSSGTTGLPKAVQLTHKNIVSNILQTENHGTGYLQPTTEDHQEVLAAFLPFFHIYGLAVIMMRSIFLGCKMITIPKFEPQQFSDVLIHHRLTVVHSVPPVILFLGSSKLVSSEHLASVKYILCGGAPHESSDNEAVLVKAKRHIGLCQIYGATETGPIALMTPVESNDFSTLVPVGSTTVKIVKPDGNLAMANEEGEICIKGPQIMKGYLNNLRATKEVIDEDGFYHTGDTGMYDEDHNFNIMDRIKELIKVKGFQVPPAELEAILRSHSQILDAAVIGIPDSKAGERPLAFVVKKKEAKIEEKNLMNFVAEKVSPYKRLSNIIFVDSVPKNPSGKILRRVLRDEYIRKIGKVDENA